jgi:hypothetical protein
MRWVENRIFHGMYSITLSILVDTVRAEHNLTDLTKVVGEMEFQLDQWYTPSPLCPPCCRSR